MSSAEIIIHLEGKDETVPVQFNPSEYSISQSARFSDRQAIGEPGKPTFLAEENSILKFKLTLDGFTLAKTADEAKAADITGEVGKLERLVRLDEKLHKPPSCTFQWGAVFFTGYAEQMNVQYTMFSPGGSPIRAVVDLSIKSASDRRIPYQSPDRTKRRVLAQDTELYMVAYEAYHDCFAWRGIAAANGIKNPRTAEAGMALRVPPLVSGV